MHELLQAGQVDLDYLVPLHQRGLAGDRRSPGGARRRAVRARRRRQAAGLGRAAPAAVDASAAGHDAGARRRRSRWPTAARAARLPAAGRALSRSRTTRRRPSAERCGVPAATIRADRRRDRRTSPSTSTIALEQPWTDTGRRARHEHRRPAGRHACHARHLGPFQRLPDLPRAAPAADAARHHRCARAACATSRPIPKPIPPAPKPAGKPSSSAPNTPLAGPPLGFPHGPEDLLVDARRHAAPHRQGVFLGCAARRPRHDAHGHRAMPARAIRTRSTCCSCTWPTWPGTRR